MLACILERKPRAVQERHRGFGDEYFTRLGERRDSRRYVHCDAAEVPRLSLDLTGMNTRPNAEVIQSSGQVDRGGAANRA